MGTKFVEGIEDEFHNWKTRGAILCFHSSVILSMDSHIMLITITFLENVCFDKPGLLLTEGFCFKLNFCFFAI